MSSTESPASRKRLRIGIVTRELTGLACSGEVATGIGGQVRALASEGDEVRVIVVPPAEMRTSIDQDRFDAASASYGELGVRITKLPPSPLLQPPYDSDEKASLGIYHLLKAEEFDAVYFALGSGLAYYTLLARETGVYLGATKFFVLVHEPTLWRSEADRFFLKNVEQLGAVFRERYCAEHADGVLCTSGAMRRWMKEHGWRLPALSEVLPPIFPREWTNGMSPDRPIRRWPVGEIVFPDSTTFHNGITLFCDALDRLAGRLDGRITVTLLGAFHRVLGEHTGGMLLRRARRWPFKLLMLPGLSEEEKLAYLRDRGCLAVLPALAAGAPAMVGALLECGLPFVATNVGGIPELVRAEDRERFLCEPQAEALATTIGQMVGSAVEPARAALSEEGVRAAWREHLGKIREPGSEGATHPRTQEEQPKVTIVLVHHDRPELLGQALESVRRQTYRNFELVLVDDGSRSAEARVALDGLEAEFRARDWRILREPNRYLGAARNAGVRASDGEFVIFLDDDNVLMECAVEELVHAIQFSKSDICTCLYQTFLTTDPPDENTRGEITYIPHGGSLDLAFFHNSIGDANAIIRRTVFEKIGYLIEDYGYACHDWEFFTRALFEGLRVRLVPEVLYWYRQSEGGMYRQSNWYSNRKPIVRLFQRRDFRGTDYFHHLALASHVGESERESLHHNLHFNAEDHPYLRLRLFEAQSNRAIETLAHLAEIEGRLETAASLRRQLQLSMEEEFAGRIADVKSVESEDDAERGAVQAGLEASSSLRGFIEESVCLPDGSFRVVGWIADLEPESPEPRIALFHHGELLGICRPDVVRPDLARGFNAPHLNEVRAQFSFVASSSSNRDATVVGIALNSNGQFAVLGSAGASRESA